MAAIQPETALSETTMPLDLIQIIEMGGSMEKEDATKDLQGLIVGIILAIKTDAEQPDINLLETLFCGLKAKTTGEDGETAQDADDVIHTSLQVIKLFCLALCIPMKIETLHLL